MITGMFIPIAAGLLLADRFARDRKARVDEIFDTLAGSLGVRLAGKYLGGTLATLVPIAFFYALGVVYIMTQAPDLQVIWLASGAFAVIVLPGILFVAGFSIAIPAVINVPIYQFLFICYWFWANLMSPKIGIPSIVATMLNAAGPWAQEAFFHFQWTFLILHATII